MKSYSLKKTIAVSALGLAALLGTSEVANAQNNKITQRQEQKLERQQERVERKQERIYSQQQRLEQQRIAQQRAAQIEQQRIREEQIRLQNQRNRNGSYSNNNRYGNNNGYNNDRYGNNNNYNNRYRVYRNGSYYNTDSRGAELLRQAVNNGYRQGVRAGQSDRAYRRNGNYRNDSIYRAGNYGYQSYVDSQLYQYYFQQGFERGYQDGYNSRYQYGTNNNGTFNILGAILSSILNLQSY